MLGALSVALLLFGAAVSGGVIDAQKVHLPTVDLGYAIHQPVVNVTGDYYAFNNIRYAEAPVGDLRFKAPVKITAKDRVTNDGSIGFKCPQAYPEWTIIEMAAAAGVSTEVFHQLILNDPTLSEDCLFLDVTVPRKVFDKNAAYRHEHPDDEGTQRSLAPVMVWLFGGGYVFGHKNDLAYNPAGLLAQSQIDTSDGIIFVAINYRLGLFGWLNGGDDDTVLPNAGLHDQHLALDWVKENIQHFGGNPNEITVFGQSSGAGSIMHHITAEAGKLKAPFERAILQSPGWQTTINPEETWAHTIGTASLFAGEPITNSNQLVNLDSATLVQINGAIVFNSSAGMFTYGPTVDGKYVPDLPGVLLLDGKFDSTPEVMLGHNLNEVALWVDPTIDTDEQARAVMKQALPGVDADIVDYITNDLYPCPSESTPWKTEYERACALVSEQAFTCNTRYLATAFGNETFNYRFQVPPGAHAQDVPWTFYNGNTTNLNPTMTKMMQVYFTNFAKHGNPNMEHVLREWPVYGDDAQMQTFGLDFIQTTVDDTANKRCEYWQKAEYRG